MKKIAIVICFLVVIFATGCGTKESNENETKEVIENKSATGERILSCIAQNEIDAYYYVQKSQIEYIFSGNDIKEMKFIMVMTIKDLDEYELVKDLWDAVLQDQEEDAEETIKVTSTYKDGIYTLVSTQTSPDSEEEGFGSSITDAAAFNVAIETIIDIYNQTGYECTFK